MDTTLSDLKAKIQEANGISSRVLLYYHDGAEIRFDESWNIGRVFGGLDAGEEEDVAAAAKIEVDFVTPDLGPVEVACWGGEAVRVLDNAGALVEIAPGHSKDVKLSRKYALVGVREPLM